jgi:hypothetical protein
MEAVDLRSFGMILTTHAIVGAALASFLPSHPAAAFVVGFASHFALDAIPHVDYPIKSRSVNPKVGAPMAFDRALLQKPFTFAFVRHYAETRNPGKADEHEGRVRDSGQRA